MVIKDLNIYSNKDRSFYRGDILVRDGTICAIGDLSGGADETVDGKGAYVVPGLIDVHTHGIQGCDWCLSDGDGYGKMAKSYAKAGVTTVMPTLSSAPLEKMRGATEALCGYVPPIDGANLAGVHWEGRYLNIEKKGAHAAELIMPLDPAELDDGALRKCKRLHISAAYELDADGSFAKKAKEIGATLGLAHTMATYAEAKKAEARGVSAYTHLFNAMPPLHHRDGGCIAAAFEGKCFAEIICDGIHIAPEMVRFAYRNLGIERLTLVSDSLDATGLPDGIYFSSGLPVTVKDGICRISTGALAGSTITLDRAVRNLMSFCNIPLSEAILAATENPARQVNIFDSCGSIDVGKRADMLFLDSGYALEIKRVMIRGNFVF
ncbi:MAG: N-acetylglucosamine-6-phosphate deacetylase [Clostridia bacterium]|nr:N-acetylglucosamine-6-phosphate deacetylase [Clostridia bacterium]